MSFRKLFDKKIEVVNVGLDSFKDDLEKQGEKVVNVDWTPP
ncbi:MAG: fdrA domain protein, partial [Candidatus Cloacimonetes bacterium]|nr:fdrA domain protein [Candidatus Cloacimonadota bacterium]